MPLVNTNHSDRGWFSIVGEAFTGAWQRNFTLRRRGPLAHYAVFSCVTLIASDISKMCVRLMEKNEKTGIWTEKYSAAFSPVLARPNLPVAVRAHAANVVFDGRRATGVAYVQDGHRHVARALMEAMLEWCKRERIAKVVLHASQDGRPLYESLGFIQTNEMRWQG